MVQQRRDQGPEEVRLPAIVVIEDGDEGVLRGQDSLAHGGGYAEGLRVCPVFEAISKCRANVANRGARRIVAYDDLPRRQALRQNALDGAAQECGALEGRNDDRDRQRIGAGSGVRRN